VNRRVGEVEFELRVLGGKIGKPLKHRLAPTDGADESWTG
jgi:hypothetical protein